MFRVPKEYKKQADFANYIILMLAIVLIVILYMEKISTILAWIISILFPFILGIGMAFVFNIISNALLRLWNHFFPIKFTKRERLLANIVSILIFLFVVFTAVMMVVPQIFTSINALISNMPEIYENARKYLMKISSYIPALNNLVNNLDLNTITNSQVVNNIESLSNIVLGSSQFMDQVNGIISTTISWFTTFFLAFAFSVFVLLNKEQFLQDIRTIAKGFMPKKGYQEGAHIYRIFVNTFTKYVGGTILECMILGTLVTIGCTLFRLPYPILIGSITAFGALVPMFGALISAILVAIFLFLQGSATQAITFLVMFIVIQQIEGNFIYPNVVGRSIGLPPMYVIVAVTLGASIGGVLGMIVFIPLLSSIYQLVMEKAKLRIQRQRFKST